MVHSIKDIVALVKQRQGEFERLGKTDVPANSYGVASGFWASIFYGRENFPDAEAFMIFRNDGSDYLGGIGGYKRNTTEDKQKYINSIIRLIDTFKVPHEYILSYLEPALGAPSLIDVLGAQYSVVMLRNLCDAYETQRLFEKFSEKSSDLRICEIGAGFGATAHVLLNKLDVAEYTIIDLPQNLYLSSLFLPLTLPARSHRVFDPTDGDFADNAADLNFVAAPFTDDVSEKYDLILNSASMGEMEAGTTASYMTWIAQALSSKGVFYGFNRANVQGANGPKRLSDFHLDRLYLHELLPVTQTTTPLNDVGFQVVAGAAEQGPLIDKNVLDPLGMLLACGFNQPVVKLFQYIKKSGCSDELAKDLLLLQDFFEESHFPKKQEILDGAEFSNPHVRAMVEAISVMMACVKGDGIGFLKYSQTLDAPSLGTIFASRLQIARAIACRELDVGSWEDEVAIINGIMPPYVAYAQELVRNHGNGLMAGKFGHSITPFDTQTGVPIGPLNSVHRRIATKISQAIGRR